MQEYVDLWHNILLELLRHESFPSIKNCTQCQTSPGTHFCRDCFGCEIWCSRCCISAHTNLPFHQIQTWNGHYYGKLDLLEHQLILSLAHDCPSCSIMPLQHQSDPTGSSNTISGIPKETISFLGLSDTLARTALTVVTSTGIFWRHFRWCSCVNPIDRYIQLLRSQLFPASFKNPQTVFMFEVLDHFRLDALECETAVLNFMFKICRMTNEAFPSHVLVHYPQLLRFMLGWSDS